MSDETLLDVALSRLRVAVNHPDPQHGPPMVRKDVRRVLEAFAALRERLAEVERERGAARVELAKRINQQEGRCATDACSGDWERCWCDTCEARRSRRKLTDLATVTAQRDRLVAAVEEHAHTMAEMANNFGTTPAPYDQLLYAVLTEVRGGGDDAGGEGDGDGK